jgi:hypothetical protein
MTTKIEQKFIVIDNFLNSNECQKLIQCFQGDELEIGDDKYGRFNFKDDKLATYIETKLKSFDVGIGLDFSVGHKFYMNKYWPKSSFIGDHMDGQIHMDGRVSIKTILIYLNTVDKGGELIIDNIDKLGVLEGRLILLDQKTFHRGNVPVSGFKYILRTDIFINMV